MDEKEYHHLEYHIYLKNQVGNFRVEKFNVFLNHKYDKLTIAPFIVINPSLETRGPEPGVETRLPHHEHTLGMIWNLSGSWSWLEGADSSLEQHALFCASCPWGHSADVTSPSLRPFAHSFLTQVLDSVHIYQHLLSACCGGRTERDPPEYTVIVVNFVVTGCQILLQAL